MKFIKLTRGYEALVDDEDYEELSSYRWQVIPSGRTVYACRHCRDENNDKRIISMHRDLLGLKYGDGREVDHINHNGIDNRRCNLRICTHRQNSRNQESATGTSRYKGVFWHAANRKWVAQAGSGSNGGYIGIFEDEVQAALAYDLTAISHWGEYAHPNFLVHRSAQ